MLRVIDCTFQNQFHSLTSAPRRRIDRWLEKSSVHFNTTGLTTYCLIVLFSYNYYDFGPQEFLHAKYFTSLIGPSIFVTAFCSYRWTSSGFSACSDFGPRAFLHANYSTSIVGLSIFVTEYIKYSSARFGYHHYSPRQYMGKEKTQDNTSGISHVRWSSRRTLIYIILTLDIPFIYYVI